MRKGGKRRSTYTWSNWAILLSCGAGSGAAIADEAANNVMSAINAVNMVRIMA